MLVANKLFANRSHTTKHRERIRVFAHAVAQFAKLRTAKNRVQVAIGNARELCDQSECLLKGFHSVMITD
jgi:hypothetical protein